MIDGLFESRSGVVQLNILTIWLINERFTLQNDEISLVDWHILFWLVVIHIDVLALSEVKELVWLARLFLKLLKA